MARFTHDGLQEDLAAHLRGNTERMVWTNLQLGPSGSPRPDVFTMNKSYARFRTDCYEIKVSVSDLRHDVTSGKWQSYRKFGNCVWFAFERGMAPLDLIPKECGIILRGDGGWRAARKPVAQVLDTLPRDTWLKLLIESNPAGWQRDQQQRIRNANSWSEQEILRKKGGDQLARLLANVQSAEQTLEYKRVQLQTEQDSIQSEIQEIRDKASEERKRQQQYLDIELQHLGEMLGVPRDQCTTTTLCSKLGALSSVLRGHGLDRMIVDLQKLTALFAEQRLKDPESC